MRSRLTHPIVRSAVVIVLLAGAMFVLGFSDVSPTHPYRQAIDALSADDIINGFDDGSFRPSSYVNRSEVLA